MMRRTILLMAPMALTLLVASGVALAVTKIGTNGPDTLRGTNGTTTSSARTAATHSSDCVVQTTYWAGQAKI